VPVTTALIGRWSEISKRRYRITSGGGIGEGVGVMVEGIGVGVNVLTISVLGTAEEMKKGGVNVLIGKMLVLDGAGV